jgi:ribosomal protein L5
MARLKDFYKDTVIKGLMDQFGYKSVMEVPRIQKITLNMGVGEAVADKKVMENAVGDMQKIAGQKPVVTLSRKSIAGFKIRDGYPVGCKVTLRRTTCTNFWTVSLPLQFLVFVTSAVFPASRSMVVAITTWVFANRSSSPKSITTRWMHCAE